MANVLMSGGFPSAIVVTSRWPWADSRVGGSLMSSSGQASVAGVSGRVTPAYESATVCQLVGEKNSGAPKTTPYQRLATGTANRSGTAGLFECHCSAPPPPSGPRKTPPPNIFRRLSSHSRRSAPYKTLGAFGRIVRSLYVLRYVDNPELRQAIEGQPGKVGLANRFIRTVAVGNPREYT